MADSYKKAVLSWCFYDWANSAFATTVMAAFFPPFFRELALAAGVEAATATAYWGYTASVAMMLVAVIAPMLGAMADHTRSRVRSVGIFTATGVVFTACFAFIAPGAWKMAALLFIGANLGFAGANIFYESLLPSVAKYGDADRVSSLGYALGYVGGGLLLVINMAMVLKWEALGFPSALFALKASFFSVALWWGAFSLPLLKNVPEPGGKSLTKTSFLQAAS
ncbi:MAG: MFS transporter, partial [Desulfatibacillaceae bacterium]|nr:MFS transporter [Desulfatibacillaceae bacterium]